MRHGIFPAIQPPDTRYSRSLSLMTPVRVRLLRDFPESGDAKKGDTAAIILLPNRRIALVEGDGIGGGMHVANNPAEGVDFEFVEDGS